MLGKGGALSTLDMHVCENVSSLGMGEHGDRGVPSTLGVGGSEFLASGVGEQWDRVASTLGDGGDTLLKLGDSMGIFSMLGKGSGNSTFISFLLSPLGKGLPH